MAELQVNIRPMEETDLDAVLKVERDAFQSPWQRETFQKELNENHFAHYLVAETNEEVIGYCGVWVVLDDAHITNIAILSSMRGAKVGAALLAKSLTMAKTYGARQLSLECRVSNQAAQALYKKFGFVEGGLRKNYYRDNHEDALVMWRKLDDWDE
ncbi:[SSU ribosomal protein S18P]-alanine acetyltransferase [Salsuginibacillus halophilus]|uniref:[Ribosomal protein bS18]-alanine N-acetyltransferase n=1 Tax=Salsuginibacillus halophilus TaxID=517424 RepID=A0A2P8HL49_9BACI|nr:ribosomal protein S18-alanine N-acetyltransferase [Salsuginibacillus halophilus]PSL46931.1 [SSU ribosomal protein S18P]-alanine acetyltransferase [Salsuginibacillus halophilus]